MPTKDIVYRGVDAYRSVGASPIEVRYLGGLVTAGDYTGTTKALTFGTMFAVPFWEERGGSIDRLGVEVTAFAASAVGRVGIYSAKENIYPNTLLAGSDNVLTVDANAVVEATLSPAIVLSPGQLYWLVFLGGVATSTFRGLPDTMIHPIYGVDSAFSAPRTHLTVAQAYGALPAAFPAGAAAVVGTIPAIGVRYAA